MSVDNIERRKDIRYIICQSIGYIVETGATQVDMVGLTANVSQSGLCFYTTIPLLEGQEIKIRRNPSVSYQSAMVQWIQKIADNFYKVGLSF